MRRKALIGILISVVFLYLALRKVDYAELWFVLRNARWAWVIPNVILAVGAGMGLRAWRWMLILRPVGRVSYRHALAATMVGFMANNVLPARLGEIARAVSIGVLAKLSRSATFATIIVERIYDSFTLLLILWLVFSFSRISELTDVERVRDVGWIFLAINIVLVFMLVILQVRNEAVVHWVERVSRRFSKRIQKLAGEITEKFARGLTVHHDARTTVGVVISSLVLWFILGASNYFIFLALGFESLPLEASFVLLVVVSLLISVPSSPGYVGVFHYGVVISLGIYGLNNSEAMAVAILLHGAQYIPITLLGFYYLKREHLKLRETDETPAADTVPDADATAR
ncbi:MAG TPA: lysylphosphatidylglycerol synthase transmembrane domain-containing protein [Acidobacteriota bacterium]|nr:lysylphosphatidylglycerol synthase transmembrane domain-containing protein [Acidobacteriota bacterium]